MADWQPIETAPNGYEIGRGFKHVLSLGVSTGRSFDHPVVVSGWMDANRQPVQFYQYRLRITHWQPMPDPPRGEKVK
jgi:hypothetical protein